MSAISLSDYDFEDLAGDASEPKLEKRWTQSVRSVKIPRKQSSIGQLEQRMGTAIVAGFVAAFACEVGMKALLLTRLDEAARTHDLLRLYGSLPADCRDDDSKQTSAKPATSWRNTGTHSGSDATLTRRTGLGDFGHRGHGSDMGTRKSGTGNR